MDPLGQKLLHALCGQKFLPFGPKTDFFNSIRGEAVICRAMPNLPPRDRLQSSYSVSRQCQHFTRPYIPDAPTQTTLREIDLLALEFSQ